MKKRAGFTLVELMVGVAITGIVAAIAVPSILNYLNLRGVTAAANQAFIDLHRIRTQAIKTRQNATVTFDVGLNEYRASLRDPSTGVTTNLVTVALGSYRGQVRLMNAAPAGGGGAATNNIGFTLTGTCPVGSSGAIYITNFGFTSIYRVRSSLAGGLAIHRWNPPTNSWSQL